MSSDGACDDDAPAGAALSGVARNAGNVRRRLNQNAKPKRLFFHNLSPFRQVPGLLTRAS